MNVALLYIDCWWSISWSLQVWSKCVGVWSNAIMSRQTSSRCLDKCSIVQTQCPGTSKC